MGESLVPLNDCTDTVNPEGFSELNSFQSSYYKVMDNILAQSKQCRPNN